MKSQEIFCSECRKNQIRWMQALDHHSNPTTRYNLFLFSFFAARESANLLLMGGGFRLYGLLFIEKTLSRSICFASNTKEPPLLSLKGSLLAGLVWEKASWQFLSWEFTLWRYTRSSGSQRYSLTEYIQRDSARGGSQQPGFHWEWQFFWGNPCPVLFAFCSSELAQSEICLDGNWSGTWLLNIIIWPLYVPYGFCSWIIWFWYC